MHTKPDDAVSECDHLTDVYDDAVQRYNGSKVTVLHSTFRGNKMICVRFLAKVGATIAFARGQ